ncbi:MAG: glycosyltransferase [Lachnospiraceae bacterium]|nr:glycosyltransferase [Lachnospiraceae bacterium]
MILQNIIFPIESICDEEELYYRKIGIPFCRNTEENGLRFIKDQRVNFDTYFNSFSLFKWWKYTNVNNVRLNLKLEGQFTVNLVHYYFKENYGFEWQVSDTYIVGKQGRTEMFSFDYKTDNPFGLLTFELMAMEDNSILRGGYYSSDVEPECMQRVKIGIGICTYKREHYVKNNMQNISRIILENNECPIRDQIEVFISDNAQTLSGIFDKENRIHVFNNKNTGGSGGFSRTMIEVNRANLRGEEFTHILLMDDDVIFEPESIFRTHAILSVLKEEYRDAFVGGAMFFTDRKYMQHANGEYWHGERWDSFITTYNLDRDMRKLNQIVENEYLTDANYQAWWYCAIPMSICRLDNLSLPLFIKSDDIEFSMRNLKHLVTLNGIAVWHESFESKYSASNEYYTVRNYLITTSIHHVGLGVGDIMAYVKKSTRHLLSNYKYRELELFYQGIEDFLKGVDYLKSIDPESYHPKIMAGGYKMVNADELDLPFSEKLYYDTLEIPNSKSILYKLVRLFTLNGLLLPSDKVVALGMWGGTHTQTFRAKYIIRYEPVSKKAFVLKRSKKKFFKNIFLYFRLSRKVKKRFEAAKRDFAERYEELIGVEFWEEKI